MSLGLLEEYRQSYSDLLEMEKHVANSEHSKNDVPVIRKMIRSMKEVIYWLETGYDPAEVRAKTRTDAYVMDHFILQDILSNKLYYIDNATEERETAESHKERIEQALEGLTENERKEFIMIRVEFMTYAKIAELLGVKRSTVQSYVLRAEKKIQRNLGKLVA